jgi:hypothetical protein
VIGDLLSGGPGDQEFSFEKTERVLLISWPPVKDFDERVGLATSPE